MLILYGTLPVPGASPKMPQSRASCLDMQHRVMEGTCSGQSRPCKRKPAPFTRGAGFEEKGVLTQEKEERGRCLFLERLPAQPGKSVATPRNENYLFINTRNSVRDLQIIASQHYKW